MVTRIVDLRSDTCTKPTEAMRDAMSSAEVDDDVLGYDPTAFRLETEMAKIMGKEAALFVPSGTIVNLISVLFHCDVKGSEVILGDNCHIYVFENGGVATIGGVHPWPVKNNDDGTIDIDLIEASLTHVESSSIQPPSLFAWKILMQSTWRFSDRIVQAAYFGFYGLNEVKGLRVDACSVETNMVFIDIEEAARIREEKICMYLEERVTL